MIELWHCRDARSFRVLWALEEMGLEYSLHSLPFPPRARAPAYLELNPLGTIPLLRDGNTAMTESSAILQYLAVRHGPTPIGVAPEEPDYGAWLNWMCFGEATLTFPQTIVLRYRRLEPEPRRLPQAADDYAQWFLSAPAPRRPRPERDVGLAVREPVHHGRYLGRLRLAAGGSARPGRALHARCPRLLGAAFGAARLPGRQAGAVGRAGASGLRHAGDRHMTLKTPDEYVASLRDGGSPIGAARRSRTSRRARASPPPSPTPRVTTPTTIPSAARSWAMRRKTALAPTASSRSRAAKPTSPPASADAEHLHGDGGDWRLHGVDERQGSGRRSQPMYAENIERMYRTAATTTCAAPR